MAGIDVLSLRTFFEILSESGLGHRSYNTEHNATPHEHRHTNGKAPNREAHEPTLVDQSPRSHANHLKEKASRL